MLGQDQFLRGGKSGKNRRAQDRYGEIDEKPKENSTVADGEEEECEMYKDVTQEQEINNRMYLMTGENSIEWRG